MKSKHVCIIKKVMFIIQKLACSNPCGWRTCSRIHFQNQLSYISIPNFLLLEFSLSIVPGNPIVEIDSKIKSQVYAGHSEGSCESFKSYISCLAHPYNPLFCGDDLCLLNPKSMSSQTILASSELLTSIDLFNASDLDAFSFVTRGYLGVAMWLRLVAMGLKYTWIFFLTRGSSEGVHTGQLYAETDLEDRTHASWERARANDLAWSFNRLGYL